MIDDDKDFVDIFKEKLEKICKQLNFPIEIVCESVLVRVLNSTNIYDIYFIDIEMPEMSGIELVNRLRNCYIDKEFVFVSAHEKYIKPSIFVKPSAFICKGNLDEDLYETISFFKKIWDKKNAKIILKDNFKEICFLPFSIKYCCSKGHYVDIHLCENEVKVIRTCMKQVENELVKHDFLRIHNRCLVNLNYVEKFEKEYVILRGGENLRISRAYRKNVENCVLRWFDYINTNK